MNRRALEFSTACIFYIIGCFVYSAGVTVFITPNEISPGGFTGISTALNYLFGIPSGIILLILNVPVIIVGFIKLGRSFIARTAFVTFILSFSLEVSENLLPHFVGDKILAGVFGGIMMGFGLSLVFLKGATTGGIDIIAKLINRKFRHLTVGRLILFMDAAVIIFAAFVYGNIESALYSVISMYVSSKMLDAMLYGADKGKIVYIITDSADEICAAVGERMKRGVTRLRAVGGYTGNERLMLMCVLRVQEVSALYSIAEEFDPSAFIVVAEAGEIIGEGFRKHNL